MNDPIRIAAVDGVPLAPLPTSPGAEWGTQAQVFEEIFTVFLILGTIVGVVVITYTLYNAYKYRDTEGRSRDESDRPVLGELPVGEGGGRKLFLSFFMSAIIVIGLVTWTYFALLYVEAGPDEAEMEGAGADGNLDVQVVGYQFGWEFQYPNGHNETNELRVPEDRVISLTVTSRDVWHNFGIPEQRVKSDAIPGQTSEDWFIAEETGTYEAYCFELCGVGHSSMNADVIVMEEEEFEEWYEDPEAYQNDTDGGAEGGANETNTSDGTGDTNTSDGTGDTNTSDGTGDTNTSDGTGDTNTSDGTGDTNTSDGTGDTNTSDGASETNTSDAENGATNETATIGMIE